MGFFANRWIEKHGAETEKAAISSVSSPSTQTKSKWYSRKKESDNGKGGTGIPTSDSQPPTNTRDRSLSEQGNAQTAPIYGTWGTSSKPPVSPIDTGSVNAYGTIRKSTLSPGPMSAPALIQSRSRQATDSVTVTLAQKLDELATANSDGLLSDDEYRILRQNLFERFGSVAAQIPTEQSPITLPSPSTRNVLNQNAEQVVAPPTIPQGDSNFKVSRSSRSIRSNHSHTSSVQTAITSLIRKATRRSSTTGRTSFGGSGNDGDSVYSRNSSMFQRGALPRTLVHKASTGSVGTSTSAGVGTSGGAYDVRSIASRRTNRSGLDNATIVSRTTSRSRPPSSYHRRHAPSEGGWSDEIGPDWTAAELRAEIISLEEESRRVADMFNGLEMTVMTKHRPALGGRPGLDSNNPLPSPKDGNLDMKPLPDIKRVAAQEKQSSRLSISSSSMRSFAALQRKGSLSFLSGRRSQALPPLPPLPTSATSPLSASTSTSPALRGSLSNGSLHPMVASQSNRSSPNLSMDTRVGSTSHGRLSRSRSGNVGAIHGRADPNDVLQGEMDPEQVALDSGLDDIRKKRANVALRYDKRLEYLRARLRTAELHERLLK